MPRLDQGDKDRPNGALQWTKQLVTKEDPFYIHKILGILCLGSYGGRWLLHFGSTSDMAFRTHPEFTLPTIALHGVLSASSFIFRIPNKRILNGSRIWPEYRYHSLIFLWRSLAVIGLYWYEQVFDIIQPIYIGNLVIVLLAMAAGDWASWSVGKYHSRSIRDLQVPPVVKFFFSLIQFKATTLTVYGIRRYALFFQLALTIQVTAFVMTLVRKNLLSHNGSVIAYSLLLVWNLIPGLYDYAQCGWNTFLIAESLSHLAAMLRMRPDQSNGNSSPILRPLLWMLPRNKYLVWITIHVLAGHLRPLPLTDNLPEWMSKYQFVLMVITLNLSFLLFAWYKIRYDYLSAGCDKPDT